MNETELLESLIGKTKEEAKEICENAGYVTRIVREDLKKYIITMDLRVDRINLSLDEGIITHCEIF